MIFRVFVTNTTIRCIARSFVCLLQNQAEFLRIFRGMFVLPIIRIFRFQREAFPPIPILFALIHSARTAAGRVTSPQNQASANRACYISSLSRIYSGYPLRPQAALSKSAQYYQCISITKSSRIVKQRPQSLPSVPGSCRK